MHGVLQWPSVASYAAGTKTDNEVVELMIGREYSAVFPERTPRPASDSPPLLDVRKLNWTDRLSDISLELRAGEVIGLGGLDGQGQRELLLALFGVLHGATGEIAVDGKAVTISGPYAAKRREIGMALIPEDRKTEGLMLPMSVRDNLSFAALAPPVALGRRRQGRPSALRSTEWCGFSPFAQTVSTCRRARCRAAISRRSSSANG
jgi:ribose transport system ATP-binding protein